MGDPRLWRYARRGARVAWWIVTPWRLRERLAFMRERAAARERAAEEVLLAEHEKARVALRRAGRSVPAGEPLDLFDDQAASMAAGLPLEVILWPAPHAEEPTDLWSAARFCISLWRARPDLRGRFPGGFGGAGGGSFGAWLQGDGHSELGLGKAAGEHLARALEAGLSEQARQAFLAHDTLVTLLPHGLTPAGMRQLFRWFMQRGVGDAGLRPEQVWWLFLEAEQDPVRELMLAYEFAPSWQQAHPAGLTVFGRPAFAEWFAVEYGAAGRWVNASEWPQWQAPALQIRLAYQSRAAWRAAAPDAFADEVRAGALLDWLSSPEAGLDETARAWCRRLDRAAVSTELTSLGANVIGHFCYPSGLRVSVESMVQAMGRVGVSTSLRDVRTDAQDDPHHVDYRGMEVYDVTIIHTQPVPFFDAAYARANLHEREPRTYRIGYWYWEFDSIPDSWVAHAAKVDEVWAATEFVARGLRERLSIPVRTLFPGVKLAPFERRGLSYFGLSDGPFTFLFTFHMMSVMERKNPLGLIRAFKSAFRQDEAVRLVLKTSFGDRHPAQLQELRDAASGANITVIDQVYSPDEVLSLMDACDAYVSLHRSEGLGLTMAEAMLMGKPVIATNFSGNVDFMDDNNSLLVPYELVKLGRPIPPYDAELRWAEPSCEEASRLMRQVFDNPSLARDLGVRGKASAEANLSLEAAGRRIAGRLAEIRALRRQTA